MDIVKEPNHYQTNNRESIEIMKDMSTTEEFEGFLKLTAHKYLYRYNSKGNVSRTFRKRKSTLRV
jgi:predicted metalloprotease with PDZ domain